MVLNSKLFLLVWPSYIEKKFWELDRLNNLPVLFQGVLEAEIVYMYKHTAEIVYMYKTHSRNCLYV